jgi:hypothetical protein
MDPLAITVAARYMRAELLTKQWLMGVRRGWLHLLSAKPNGWPAIFKAFDALRDFVDNLEEQVKFVRRGPYSSHSTMSEGEKLDQAFKKLKEAITEKRRSAEHWMRVDTDPRYGQGTFPQNDGAKMRALYEEKFGDLLTTYVKTKKSPEKGRWNDTREAPITELLDKVLEILRADAARLQESIKTEKEQIGESPSEEVFKDPAYKEFSFGHNMKVIVTDPKGNGHHIRSYIRLLDIAHQLTVKKGFGYLWYGVLFLESTDYKHLSDAEQESYSRAGYSNLRDTAGTFHSGDDHVVITAPADDYLIKTIIHELGHRYWFKFMSAEQRARFADLIRTRQKPLLRKPIDPKTLEDARKEILAIGNQRKQLMKDFEDDFRASADSAEVEKHIKEYAPKFKEMVLKDPILDVLKKTILPSTAYTGPESNPLHDSLSKAFEVYTGKETSAEVKFRRHMLPEAFEGAWKRGMSDGMNAWLREAFKLQFDVEDAALEYIKHVGSISERKLDPDESKVMPVSDYGMNNPEEAFAEAFAYYVMGKDMTRDQMESFRSVLSTEVAFKFAAVEFKPEKRRTPKPHEYEIMKGRGDRQTWFYVKSLAEASTLIRLGRNYGFPTGITRGPKGYPEELGISESGQSVIAEESEPVTEFVAGFFKRHPNLHRFAPEKVIGKTTSGSGPHPEASQHGDSILLFPKFWKLDAKTRDFVFAHELGHHVLSNYGLPKLIEGLQARGVDPWESQNLPFGQTNMDEAFADSFASHFLNRAELQRRYPEWAAEVAAIISR